jgi:hypothetical protein
MFTILDYKINQALIKKVFYILNLLSFSTFAQGRIEGDPIGKMSPLKLPKMYEQPTGAINKKNAEPTKNPGHWIVFSDREENKTFADKNCTKEYSSVNFMQPLMVVDQTDNEVRVVEYDPADMPVQSEGKKTLFKSNAVEKGWIKKTKLLLWSISLVNDTTKYSMKAIAVKKLGDNQEITNLINKGRVLDLYDAPFIDKKYQNIKDSKLFEYLFVLKEDKESKMLLISRRYKTNASNSKQDVLGWVPNNQVHKWDNALCLRINFADVAINERKDKAIEAQFFKTKEEARKFKNGQKVIGLPFEYGSAEKAEPDNPYYYGFPIIEDAKDEAVIFKTGYVTNTTDAKGNSIFNNYEKATFDQKFELLKKQKEKVNIIFAIDGNALKNFAKAIKDFVKNSQFFRADDQTTNKYQIGAIIYNGVNSGDDEKFWKVPLSNDATDFCERIDRLIGKVVVSERSVEGAPLFEAIDNACDVFSKEKTNILIVAGLTKGTDTKFKNSSLDKLVDKQVKMSIFQVANKGGKMYDGFIYDAKWLLQNSAEKIDLNYTKKVQKSESFKVKSKLEPVNENKFVLKFSAIPGEINVKDEGTEYMLSKLTKDFNDFVRSQEDNLNNYLNSYKENTITGRKEDVNENRIEQQKQLAAMLTDAGISSDAIDKLSEQENFQLFISAYTSIENKNLANQLLLRTLFMQKKEFERLQESFDLIADASSTDAQRIAVTNAFQQIIVSYKGVMDPKEVANFTSDDIFKLITSLPKTNNDLFKISLKDLRDVKKTPDEDIRKLSQDFNNISRSLKEVRKNKIYHYDTDDETFFWVPESVFRLSK